MTDVVKYSFSNLEKVAQFVYPITEKVKSLVGKIEKLISENKILKIIYLNYKMRLAI